MAQQFRIERPNRDKASSKSTKAVVILLLIATAGLVALVTIFGWSKLAGMKPVQIGFLIVYLVMAYYVARWNRGVLPIAAALSIILGIFAAIAGPQWFDRDKAGFASPKGIFGIAGFDANVLGFITLLIVPVSILVIVFAMQGFRQEWQVEIEIPIDDDGNAVPAAA
jgi:presenilin-like A22 family membrane protease